jgi:hypothetical protein
VVLVGKEPAAGKVVLQDSSIGDEHGKSLNKLGAGDLVPVHPQDPVAGALGVEPGEHLLHGAAHLDAEESVDQALVRSECCGVDP